MSAQPPILVEDVVQEDFMMRKSQEDDESEDEREVVVYVKLQLSKLKEEVKEGHKGLQREIERLKNLGSQCQKEQAAYI